MNNLIKYLTDLKVNHMNSKKAKALRRLVKNAQKSKPELFTQEEYVENVDKRKKIIIEDLDENGNVVTKDLVISSGQYMLDTSSAKGLYRTLKIAANRTVKQQ